MAHALRTVLETNGQTIEKVVDKRWTSQAEYLVKWLGVQGNQSHTWVLGTAICSDKGHSEVYLYERQQPDPAGLADKLAKDSIQLTQSLITAEEKWAARLNNIHASLAATTTALGNTHENVLELENEIYAALGTQQSSTDQDRPVYQQAGEEIQLETDSEDYEIVYDGPLRPQSKDTADTSRTGHNTNLDQTHANANTQAQANTDNGRTAQH